MVKNIRKFIDRLHNDTSGAMSVEKIMIISIIALPIVIALISFRDKLFSWFTEQTPKLNDNTVTTN